MHWFFRLGVLFCSGMLVYSFVAAFLEGDDDFSTIVVLSAPVWILGIWVCVQGLRDE